LTIVLPGSTVPEYGSYVGEAVTKERRMAVTGAGFIILAAAALSAVNYFEGSAYWALIVVGAVCFLVGVCLYFYSISRSKGKQ
jgi:Na+/melibiose symporter-like transporter